MDTRHSVRALMRGIEILKALNRLGNSTTLQISRDVGIPRSTVHRLLETLEEMSLVTRSPSDEAWCLTLNVRSLSDGYDDDAWVRDVALPVINALQTKIIWPTDIVTFDRDAMIIRETTHRISPFSVDRAMAGRKLPLLKTAAGRAYLAFCPPNEHHAILERLRHSNNPDDQLADDWYSLAKVLAETRELGYGWRIDGYRPGTSSISLPIQWDKRVLACISVIWITSAIPFSEAVEKLLPHLHFGANEIAKKLSLSPINTKAQ